MTKMKHIAEYIHTYTVTTAARYSPFASKMTTTFVKCIVNNTLAHTASRCS